MYLSRCIDVYLCMGRIFLGASMLEHGAYLSRCVDVRMCMGRIFLGASMSSLWDWPSFSCDLWISIWWFLEFMFRQLLRLALIYMSFIVAWWMKLGVWHSFLSLRRSLRYWLISYWFFNYLFITAWHCDYYTFSHISYSISFHLIFIARLIRLLFSS